MAGPRLRFYDPDGNVVGDMPDPQGVQRQIQYNDTGTLAFAYPHNGKNAALLNRDDGLFAVVDAAGEGQEWYLLEDDGDDPADEAGAARQVMVGARGALALLERAVIYPAGHSAGQNPTGLDPHFNFVNASPGAIMGLLLDRAHARGAITQVDYDFTATHDSAGNPWPTLYSVNYDCGLDLLKVALAMADNAWADVRMRRHTVQMFVPDTYMATDRPDVVLRLGREILSGPRRKRSRRDIRTVMLGVGSENAVVEMANSSAMARWDRREGYASNGNITNTGTLATVTQSALDSASDASEGFTVIYDPSATNAPQPGVRFEVGNKIRYDQRRLDASTLEPLRVRSIAWTYDDETGAPTVSLELNDLFVEQTLRLKRKVDGIVNNSSTPAAPLPYNDGSDKTVPKGPDAVGLDAAVYTLLGDTEVAVSITWPDVALNTDGSAYSDHGYYVVEIAYGQHTPGNWTGGWQVHDVSLHIDRMTPGYAFKARVRAVDFNGNAGAWTESATINLPVDSTPPPIPSDPTTTVRMSTIAVHWDGKDLNGADMPADFDLAQIHRSTSGPGFTPDASTLFATLNAAGAGIFTEGEYGTTYYFRLVAVDRDGNVSAPSGAAEASPEKATTIDLGTGSVSFDALAFKQAGNLIPDGTFADPTYQRALLDGDSTRSWGLSFGIVTDGAWALTLDASRAPGSTVTLNLLNPSYGMPGPDDGQSALQVTEGEQYLFRCKVKNIDGANGSIRLGMAVYDKDGTLLSASAHGSLDVYPSTSSGFRTASTAITIPTGGAYAYPYVRHNSSASTGTWYIEQAECRPIVTTALIADAAIQRAQIDDLAVNDAKIANLNGGKIDAASIRTDRLALGVIATNLLRNGGFEETLVSPSVPGSYRNIAGWTGHARSQGISATFEWGFGGVAARTGVGKAVIQNNGSSTDGGYIESDPFPVLAGETYTLQAALYNAYGATAYVRFCTSPDGVTFTDQPGEGDNLYVTGNGPDSAMLVSVDYAVPQSGVNWARVRIYNNGRSGSYNFLCVDDCSVIRQGEGAVELSPSGLRMWEEDGTESVSLSAVGAHGNFASFGHGLANIDTDGGISAVRLSAVDDLEVQGKDLVGSFLDNYDHPNLANADSLLNILPRGLVAFGQEYFTDWSATGPSQHAFMELDFYAEPGRSYRVTCESFIFNASAQASAGLMLYLATPSYPGGVAPTPSISNDVAGRFYNQTTGAYTGMTAERVLRCNASGDKSGGGDLVAGLNRVLFVFYASTSGVTYHLYGGSPITCTVEDVGLDTPDTGQVFGSYASSGGGGGTSSGSTTTRKSYTKSYAATWSRSFTGSGGYNSYYGSQLVQGYYSGNNGNQRGMVGFNDSQIRSDLAGATVTACSVTLYSTWWYYNAGGEGIIGTHGQSSAPSTFSGNTARLRSPSWPKGARRTLNLGTTIGNEFKSGVSRGITVGPGPTTDRTYYGKFAGVGQSYAPVLTISYTK